MNVVGKCNCLDKQCILSTTTYFRKDMCRENTLLLKLIMKKLNVMKLASIIQVGILACIFGITLSNETIQHYGIGIFLETTPGMVLFTSHIVLFTIAIIKTIIVFKETNMDRISLRKNLSMTNLIVAGLAFAYLLSLASSVAGQFLNYSSNGSLSMTNMYYALLLVLELLYFIPAKSFGQSDFSKDQNLSQQNAHYKDSNRIPAFKTKSVTLTGLSGDYAGAILELTPRQRYVFGKDASQCQFVFTDTNVSRVHMTISFDDRTSSFILEDSSKNGTYIVVNDEFHRIKEPRVKLPMGTVISMGNKHQVFRLG